MKRTCMNHINRNNTALYNHMRNNLPRSNIVTPEILMNQIWVQEENKCNVKITELNSSSNSSKESPRKSCSAWNYINNDRFQDIHALEVEELQHDNYIVNEAARCKRSSNQNDNMYIPHSNQYYLDRNVQSNSNTYYDPYDTSAKNHQMNCFTIINNQHVNSDSSTDNENYEVVEIMEVDGSDKTRYWDHVYNEEVITYDPNTQSEKRTIWIYSYKNKRLLSDDYDSVNIPSKDTTDTSTSCPTSDEEQRTDKCTNSRRISSPIPASYVVPRLDLSLVQTLSTVTEISEPNKSQSKNSLHETINLKQRNNWLTDRNDNTKKEHYSTVVDWMALSPRERRRRSINTNLDITKKENVNGVEVTYAEGSTQLDQMAIKSRRVESSTVKIQVDIHANEDIPFSENLNRTTRDNACADMNKKIAHTPPADMSIGEADSDSVSDKIEFDFSNMPSIQIKTKPARTITTDPIEHLHSETWIAEEQVEKETRVHNLENADFDPKYSIPEIDLNMNHASNRLWKRNLQLMKPPEWAEYLPITSTPPSLHLTISLTSLNGKKPWFKRLKSCIICCK